MMQSDSLCCSFSLFGEDKEYMPASTAELCVFMSFMSCSTVFVQTALHLKAVTRDANVSLSRVFLSVFASSKADFSQAKQCALFFFFFKYKKV